MDGGPRFWLIPLTAVLFLFLHLLGLFISAYFLEWLEAIFLLVLTLLYLPFSSRGIRAGAVACILLGAVIMIFGRVDCAGFVRTYHSRGSIVSLLVLVPVTAIPFAYREYLPALAAVMKGKRRLSLSLAGTLINFFLGGFILVGVLPLMYNILKGVFRYVNSLEEGFILKLLSRSFALAALWSPNFAIVGLILDITGKKWLELLPYSLIFALLFLSVHILALARGEGFLCADPAGARGAAAILDKAAQKEEDTAAGAKYVRQLVLIGLTFFVLLLSLEKISNWSIIDLVPLVSLALAFCWACCLRSGRTFLFDLKQYFVSRVPGLGNQLLLFLGASVMGDALANSEWGSHLFNFVHGVMADSVAGIVLFIYLFIILLSLLGLHPMVTVVILSPALGPFLGDGALALLIALTMLVSTSLAIAVSPFSMEVMIIAALSGKTPFEVGVRGNGLFVLALSVVAVFLLVALGAAKVNLFA